MTPIPFEKVSEEDLIFFSGVACDRDDDVNEVFDKALFVERLNKRLIGKGKPKMCLFFRFLGH